MLNSQLTKGQSACVIATFIAVYCFVLSDINCFLLNKYRREYFQLVDSNRFGERRKSSMQREEELRSITVILFNLHDFPHLNCSTH